MRLPARPLLLPAVASAALTIASQAGAQDITSAYTDLAADKTCTTYAAADPNEGGDWANLVCDGYRGYPVFLFYGDARESLFYGFPPAGDLAPVWESFGPFNSTGPKIEWRLERKGERTVPFATIHRWFVSDPYDETQNIEVLVVEKVGQPHERDGCAVTMTWTGTRFEGGTTTTECATSLGGDYAASDVTIEKAQLTSWDRGFYDDGTQAWGVTGGPYEFIRRTAEPAD